MIQSASVSAAITADTEMCTWEKRWFTEKRRNKVFELLPFSFNGLLIGVPLLMSVESCWPELSLAQPLPASLGCSVSVL